MPNIAHWTSPAGEVISFHIYSYADDWNYVGGIYMMCKFDPYLNGWLPAYIGQAKSFRDRIPNHEEWKPSVRLGAQRVLAVVESSQNKRDALEQILIQCLNPPLNTQLKPPALGLGGILNYRP
jgi:hypothetical protein